MPEPEGSGVETNSELGSCYQLTPKLQRYRGACQQLTSKARESMESTGHSEQ
jgi:hypothetical protein